MKTCFATAVLFAALGALAAPRLKPQSEIVAPGELKACMLVGSEAVPAPSLEARCYRLTRGGETTDVKWYVPAEVWRLRARVGEWRDRQGNRLRIARVKSLVPKFDRVDWYREEIDKGLDDLEKSFTGSEAELAEWARLWGGRGSGRFATLADGRRYYVELEFAEQVRPAEGERLLNSLVRSVAPATGRTKGSASSKWWERETGEYRFIADLEKGKGEKFIRDLQRELGAMRRAYESYVPPQRQLPRCTVRLFRTLEGYRAYRLTTGVADFRSDGLWDPTRDELLVAAPDPKKALSTMRHEGFHQYLAYATGRGDHAPWFDEGHATFFENVKYDPAKDEVTVIERGNRAEWVERDPVRYANALFPLVLMSHDEFSSGDLNLHYVAAWALTYFLEKGAYADEEFAPYREVCPTYLAAMRSGASPEEATRSAWTVLAERNLAEDFMKFWTRFRKAALKVRPKPKSRLE